MKTQCFKLKKVGTIFSGFTQKNCTQQKNVKNKENKAIIKKFAQERRYNAAQLTEDKQNVSDSK